MNDLIVQRVDQARTLLALARDAVEAKTVADMAHAAAIYAKRQKLSQDAIDYANSVKIDAMRLMGEFLALAEKNKGSAGQGRPKIGGTKTVPPKNEQPTLAEAHITKNESSLCQKLAKLAKDEPEQFEAIRESKVPVSSVFSSAHVSRNTGDNDWNTPNEIIDLARTVMGGIDLDPASNPAANKEIQAAKFYTKDDDGLVKQWKGRVWMNPPYSGELIALFTEKLAESYQSGNVTQAIALVNNATETGWFQGLAAHATHVCFPFRRVKFWYPPNSISQPLQGQAIFYLGDRGELFADTFLPLGLVCAFL